VAAHAGSAGLGPDNPAQPERGEPSITPRFTILLIDDDDLVLSMLTELLSAMDIRSFRPREVGTAWRWPERSIPI